jgi:hypothetical protein
VHGGGLIEQRRPQHLGERIQSNVLQIADDSGGRAGALIRPKRGRPGEVGWWRAESRTANGSGGEWPLQCNAGGRQAAAVAQGRRWAVAAAHQSAAPLEQGRLSSHTWARFGEPCSTRTLMPYLLSALMPETTCSTLLPWGRLGGARGSGKGRPSLRLPQGTFRRCSMVSGVPGGGSPRAARCWWPWVQLAAAMTHDQRTTHAWRCVCEACALRVIGALSHLV